MTGQNGERVAQEREGRVSGGALEPVKEQESCADCVHAKSLASEKVIN